MEISAWTNYGYTSDNPQQLTAVSVMQITSIGSRFALCRRSNNRLIEYVEEKMNTLTMLAQAGSDQGQNLSYTFPGVFGDPALAVVAFGGFVGGLLQPVVAKFNPRTAEQPNINYLISPLLGIAAAGISVYVVAHTDTTKALPLFFFSMLCGLGFPAVLVSAVDGIGKNTANVQKQVSKIAEQADSNDPAVVADATKQLKEVMVNSPAGSVTLEGQTSIAATASRAVANIAQTAQAVPEHTRDIVEQLKEVATVAQSAGYGDTARAAADQLEMLSQDKGLKDGDAKLVAKEAAERIKGQPES